MPDVDMKLLPQNFQLTRNMATNCYALLIYALIVAKILMLQYVDVSESCNPESVEGAIHGSLYDLFVSIPFFALFLIFKNAKWKNILFILSCCPFILAASGLNGAICCHESYGDSPMELYILLLLTSVTFLIIRSKHYILLFISYIIFIIVFKSLLTALIRVGIIRY